MRKTLARLLSSGGKFIGLGLLLVLALAALWQLTDRVFAGNKSALNPSQLRAIYAELNGDTTTLWTAPLDLSGQKEKLADISHQTGYGIRGNLSPDGTKIGFTLLPPGSRDTASSASLWVVDVKSGEKKPLVDGVDLRTAPLFSLDGTKLLYRRTKETGTGGLTTELYSLDLATLQETRLVSDELALGLYPIDWAKDGEMIYYSRVSNQGTDVMAVAISAGMITNIGHVSDGIARDFRLSPDGQKILYTARLPGGDYCVGILHVKSKGKDVLIQGANDHYGPIWQPVVDAVTLSTEPVDPTGKGRLLNLAAIAKTPLSTIPAPPGGFDVPTSWSPDGRYLAVRSFQGESSHRITSEKIVVISPSNGGRHELGTSGPAQFIGWLTRD